MLVQKKLSNGLELIIKKTAAPVAAIQVWVDVGSIDEKPQEAGYCHFLEHMLFKGTTKRTTAQIAGTIEGAGGEMNAFTSFEYTVYHITLSNEKWMLANSILSDMVLNSSFEKKEFDPEKEVILEEIKRGEDSPDRQLYQGMYRQLFDPKNYGRPVIGFPKTVKQCSAAGLKKFWQKWYSPELMTVVIVGDVDPVSVEKEVIKTWGRAKAKKALRCRRRDLKLMSVLNSSQKKLEEKKLKNAREFSVNSLRWVGALPACDLRSPDLPALDLLCMILGQGDSSRLHRKVFREKDLVTSIYCGVWAPMNLGMITFDVDATVAKSGKFRQAIFDEIERICVEGPTHEELERAKVALEVDRVYGQQSMEAMANRLGFLGTTTGNLYFDIEYQLQCKDLTCEDIRIAALKYFNLEKFNEYLIYPDKKLSNNSSFDLKKFWDQHDQSSAVHQRKKIFDRTRKSRQSLDGLIQLKNGITLVLNEKNDLPLVSIQACVLGGLRAEHAKISGIGSLLSEVWDKGPSGMTAEKFAATLEAKGARIGAFSGKNSLGLSCSTLSNHLEEVLPLYSQTLFDPALAEEEFLRAKNLAIEDIKTLEDDLPRLAGKIFAENLYQDHPYSLPTCGTLESVSNLSVTDMKSHFRRLVSGGEVVVAVSGKFNSDFVISQFEKNIHTSKHQPKGLGFLAPKFQALKSERLVEVIKKREQNHLIVGFLGTRVSDLERYDLRVLLTVLGGQSGRLFREIRDRQGLCYTVAPISFEGIEPGYVGVYIGCDPKKREQALKAIRIELDKLVSKPITSLELERAKQFVLGRYHMDMQLNSSIASSQAFNTLYGLGHNEHTKIADGIRRVSIKSIYNLSQKLFSAPSVTALIV